MNENVNSINWFEIPVSDFERAREFYAKIFDIEIEKVQMGPNLMGFFPFTDGSGKVSGALVQGEIYKPSTDGTLIYLNGNPNLSPILSRVKEAGGDIMVDKMQITPEIGYMAIIVDSEGNRIAIHSQQ